MKSLVRFILPVLILVSLGTGGYLLYRQNSRVSTPLDRQKIQVVASFYPLAFFTERIGGNLVQVKTITPPGTEPHDYDLSAQDIAAIEHANLLVLNGYVETWGEKIRENLRDTKIRMVIAGEGLFSGTDPHLWLDPVLAGQESEKIADALISIDPTNASEYRKNQTALVADFDQLDAKFRIGLQTCTRQDIITSHAAFGYLASRYGFRQVPIAGISPDEEPPAQTLANIAKFARENAVKYIFFERLVSPKLADTIATEVSAQTLVLDPLEGISTGKDYFTVMEENLKNLKTALECK